MDPVISYLQKDTSPQALLEHMLYTDLHAIASAKISQSELRTLLLQAYLGDFAAVKRFLVSPKFKPIRQNSALDLVISIQESDAHLGIAGTQTKIHCNYLDRFNRAHYHGNYNGIWTHSLPFLAFDVLRPFLIGDTDLTGKQNDALRHFLDAYLCTLILEAMQDAKVINALCPKIIPPLRLARSGYEAAIYLGYIELKKFTKCVHIDPILIQHKL